MLQGLKFHIVTLGNCLDEEPVCENGYIGLSHIVTGLY